MKQNNCSHHENQFIPRQQQSRSLHEERQPLLFKQVQTSNPKIKILEANLTSQHSQKQQITISQPQLTSNQTSKQLNQQQHYYGYGEQQAQYPQHNYSYQHLCQQYDVNNLSSNQPQNSRVQRSGTPNGNEHITAFQHQQNDVQKKNYFNNKPNEQNPNFRIITNQSKKTQQTNQPSDVLNQKIYQKRCTPPLTTNDPASINNNASQQQNYYQLQGQQQHQQQQNKNEMNQDYYNNQQINKTQLQQRNNNFINPIQKQQAYSQPRLYELQNRSENVADKDCSTQDSSYKSTNPTTSQSIQEKLVQSRTSTTRFDSNQSLTKTITSYCYQCNQNESGKRVLLTCLHWYCEPCLDQHIQSQLFSNTFNGIITCLCGTKIKLQPTDTSHYKIFKESLIQKQIQLLKTKYMKYLDKCLNCDFFWVKSNPQSTHYLPYCPLCLGPAKRQFRQ